MKRCILLAVVYSSGAVAAGAAGPVRRVAEPVRDALFAATTKGVVTKSRTTNNNLLFTDY